MGECRAVTNPAFERWQGGLFVVQQVSPSDNQEVAGINVRDAFCPSIPVVLGVPHRKDLPKTPLLSADLRWSG
jgi:hypothetical protein